jgi:ubiquinone/menaquinone biosynthesis C-methylase UbiE/pimeloyl-ACP methyl ester carboxylesterase
MEDKPSDVEDFFEPWIGSKEENRRSYRRRTIAPISFFERSIKKEPATATNVSIDGLYINTEKSLDIGDRLNFTLKLPSYPHKPLKVGGRVTRIDEYGMGILFEDLTSKDRNRIREYSGFMDLDDAVVELQSSMEGLITGNLLPVSEWRIIENLLKKANDKNLRVLIALSTKMSQAISARLRYDQDLLELVELDKPLPKNTSIIYCVLTDGPLQAVFEGVVEEAGDHRLRLLLPERMYHNDRRCSRRFPVETSELMVSAPHLKDGKIRLPVYDISEGGCSVLAHGESLITVGMRFPAVEFKRGNQTEKHDGATIIRLTPFDGSNDWLVGLNFIDDSKDRDAFSEIEGKSVRPSISTSLIRLAAIAKQKIRSMIVGKKPPTSEKICVVNYKNTRGETVASILDASFDLQDEPPHVDVAVVIGQPFMVRKEVFGLLARTLVDNFKALGVNGVVCRFDLTHTVGESEVDPELEAKGYPYLNWTYSQYESDIHGSLKYLERRFRPKTRVLLTYSVAAISARRLLADGHEPKADLWIAPFGCPDGQDMFKNLLAGVDLYQNYLAGKKLEPFLLYGRLADPNGAIPDAMRRGMAFLEDARKDMEKITIPVTWILGTYDYMVTRQRVRQMLNAPGGGIREVIELEAGHFLKSGPEAIESYKLIAEVIFKHLFQTNKTAVEPDLAQFARQTETEWGRTKRLKIANTKEFWNRHLFGTSSEMEGYDILLYNPEYIEFIQEQANFFDLQRGMRIADIGCGTGNLAIAALKASSVNGDQINLVCADLVPEAINRTRNKIEKFIKTSANGHYSGLHLDFKVVDLEAARLTPLKEFLSGELYGPLALAGRIEGLNTSTLRKIFESYGPRLHMILHGEDASVDEIMKICPELDEVEAESVRDISRASRFLKNKLKPGDLKPGITDAKTTNDIVLNYISFGNATMDCKVELPSNAFDRIGASLVLPYLYDPKSVVKEFYRTLAPGGRIILSSLKPNFDSSKSYIEEAEEISKRTDLCDEEKERLIGSLREFSSFTAALIELEDNGRFKFFATHELITLMNEAGFNNIKVTESLGNPPTAIIVCAEKR